MNKSTKRATKRAPVGPPKSATGERLQKILAAAGLGSRRDCEELILAGRVEVDRKLVDTLGAKADPHTQEIRVDGEPLPRTKLVYYMVNKPVGVVSTNADPAGRPRVIDLVPHSDGHLFAVGRLDLSSEGLLLVTNDGELANRLTHPRYEVEKTYQVEVAGQLDLEELKQLRRGIHLAEGFAKVKGAVIKKKMAKSTLLEIILKEGKNREIRRVLAKVGHKVLRLRRIAIGPLRLGELPEATFRPLSFTELDKLRSEAFSTPAKRAARGHRAARPQSASGASGKPKRPDGGKPARGRAEEGKFTGRATGRPASRPAGKPTGKPSGKPPARPGLGSVIGGDFAAKPVGKPKQARSNKPGRNK
jgi:23S rRNA pseudouridine2605 synthase